MTEVVAFKMVGGQEVVAEVIEEKRTGMLTESMSKHTVIAYIVRKPHILQMQQMGPNQMGLAFIPWTLSNPDIMNLEIPASAVLFTFEPSARVERQYLEQTSGISLASSM